jgi:hypothetical protein
MRDRVKHREVQRLYRKSAKGKAVRRRYKQSGKGRAKQREYDAKKYSLHSVHLRRKRAIREAGTGMADARQERYWAARAACNALWEQTVHVTDIGDLEDLLGRQLAADERDFWAIVKWTGADRFLKFKEAA